MAKSLSRSLSKGIPTRTRLRWCRRTFSLGSLRPDQRRHHCQTEVIRLRDRVLSQAKSLVLFLPEFRKPLSPTAVVLVKLIANGIFLVEVLVVLLGHVKRRRRHDLGD